MEGQGVTNYSLDKPSYAFTAATTEFDDALMKRGIVTHEQAIFAKGASSEEAQRLVAEAKHKVSLESNTNEANNGEDSDSDFDDDDDDDFMQKYRQQRLEEMKQEHSNKNPTSQQQQQQQSAVFGEVVPIQRPEWTHHVNEASHKATVVVVLTSSHVELTGSTEAAVSALAPLCPSIKFVTIPSKSAIANFPDVNLPCAFVYEDGTMVHELTASGGNLKMVTTPLQLMRDLERAGVTFGSQEQQKVKDYSRRSEEGRREVLQRRMKFMDEDEGDDDEVY